VTCIDCTKAAAEPWPGHSAGCKGCDARALARVFLAKGERGARFRRGCEQLGVTVQQVEEAHAADAASKEKT
jgi:hypothetical protein